VAIVQVGTEPKAFEILSEIESYRHKARSRPRAPDWKAELVHTAASLFDGTPLITVSILAVVCHNDSKHRAKLI